MKACDLANRKCVPCQGGVRPLSGDELLPLSAQLGDDWAVIDEHHLVREYTFKDFAGALAFTNEIGAIAEEQGHHPVITLTWGKVSVKVWTHKIDGLTESDFILASKMEQAYS